jgi:uncharacterized surface anchored protein
MRARQSCLPCGTLLRIVLAIMVLASVAVVHPGAGVAQEAEPAAIETATEPPAPTDTPTPEPTSTSQPTDSPEPVSTVEPTSTQVLVTPLTASSTPVPTSSPTSTPPPIATSTPAPGAAATTGTTKIKSVEKNGALVLHAQFQIYRDAGGGALGLYRVTSTDNDNDGYAVFTLLAGDYVAVETNPRPGFGLADNTRFSVVAGATKTVTVVHKLLSHLIVDAKEQNTGNPVSGYCYDLIPQNQPGAIQRSACDADDGSADGSTLIQGLDRFTYRIHEKNLVQDYLHAADQDYQVLALDTTYHKSITHIKGGRINVSVTDGGVPITGQCASVYTVNDEGNPVNFVLSKCDGDDGATDGITSLRGIAAGDYEVGAGAPQGYVPPASVVVHVTNGKPTQIEFPLQKTGLLMINIVNELGDSFPGPCLTIRTDIGPGGYGDSIGFFCSDSNGSIEVSGLIPGNYRIWQDQSQPGYAPLDSIPFVMTLSDSTVTVQYGLGATVVVHVKDEANSPLAGSCFSIIAEILGVPSVVASICDGDDGSADGTATLKGLKPGDYELAQASVPQHYSGAPIQPFTVVGAETKTFNLTNLPFGSILIHHETPAHAPLLGACFAAYLKIDDHESYQYYQACDAEDGADDGDITVDVPEGTNRVQETTIPDGFVRPEDVNVDVTSGATTEVTIVSPTPSTLTIRAKEGWNVPIKGQCWWVERAGDLGSGYYCDDEDGASDGVTHAGKLRGGDYTIRLFQSSPPGTIYPSAKHVVLAPMSNLDTTIVIHRPAPKLTVGPVVNDVTSSSIALYFKADQPIHGRIDFGKTDSLGQSVPGTSAYSTQQAITVSGLSPNTTYYLRAHIENDNGAVNSVILSIRTAAATATAAVKIHTIDEISHRSLPGACYSVFRNVGQNVPGDFVAGSCDEFDAHPTDGYQTIGGLPRGSYVLIEDHAPVGHRLAAKRAFVVQPGQVLSVLVKNKTGGTLLRLQAFNESDQPLKGACFEVYRNAGPGIAGDYVAGYCDVYDGLDGVTSLTGLGPGYYYLWKSSVPKGYAQGDLIPFELDADPTRTIWVTVFSFKSSRAIIAKAIDADGRLVPGACFALFFDDGSGRLGGFANEHCDGDDGSNDGRTYFFVDELDTRYILLETRAPRGFQVGQKKAFLKEEVLKTVTFRQSPTGKTLKIENYKGSSTSLLPGACFGIYRYTLGRWELMTYSCDVFDGANDGVTWIYGLPPSTTYRVTELVVPAGYKQPPTVSVTMGTTGRSLKIRTPPA